MPSIKTTILAAFAAAALAAPALADDTVDFTFNASLLDSQNGVEKVYAQIEDRAAALCRQARNSPRLRDHACEADLVADFVASIDNSALDRVHAGLSDDDQYAAR